MPSFCCSALTSGPLLPNPSTPLFHTFGFTTGAAAAGSAATVSVVAAASAVAAVDNAGAASADTVSVVAVGAGSGIDCAASYAALRAVGTNGAAFNALIISGVNLAGSGSITTSLSRIGIPG